MTVTTSPPLSRELAPAPALPQRRARGDQFLAFFGVVLGGYAIGSKGFAYLGIKPIFIGEISLALGLVALWSTRSIKSLLKEPLIRLVVAFMLFGALRTIPFLREYGMDSLRDGVLWGYGTFSVILAGVLSFKPERLWKLVERYRRFLPIYLVAAPAVWLSTVLLDRIAFWTGFSVPTWPGTDVAIIHAKAGDTLVHLAGAAAFMVVGLAGPVKKSRIALLAVGIALTALSRGGLLAFSLAFLVAFLSRPRSRSAWSVAGLFGGAVLLLAVTDLHLRFPGNDREVSFQQLKDQIVTTAGTDGPQDQQNTKAWRLLWWAKIVSYTIGGDYRWAGKGYGVNLATDDGFQVTDDDSLRSPHNATMTVLARSGVIGLALWLALLGTWFWRMAVAARKASSLRDRQWYALFVFIIAYLLAILVNGSFDVYLEGPAGGIWFWSVIGIGIGAEMIFRQRDALLIGATERAK